MKTIVLISCVKSKLTKSAIAKDLYISDLFQKMFQYAQTLYPDAIFILSAKYGLIFPENTIDPYEMTLKNMKIVERKEWSQRVLKELEKHTDIENDKFIFLCGNSYREYLLPNISLYEIPMERLRYGQQLNWLNHKLKNRSVQ